VTMAYSAEDKWVQKQTPTDTTNFLYDYKKVLQELDGSQNLLHEYTSTNDLYGDLVSAFDGSQTLYHEFDAVGSTDALLDDTGSQKDRYIYRAFGAATQTQGTDFSRFTF